MSAKCRPAVARPCASDTGPERAGPDTPIPHHCKTFPLLHPSIATMSQNPPTADSSSNYQVIFDNALKAYKTKTGKDLKSDPLLHRLETCNNPDAVLTLLRQQIPGDGQSGSSDERLTNWLNPVVNVLYNFAQTIGGAVSLVSFDKVYPS
jgi:hypothetical protein